jgi:hypothetical protein
MWPLNAVHAIEKHSLGKHDRHTTMRRLYVYMIIMLLLVIVVDVSWGHAAVSEGHASFTLVALKPSVSAVDAAAASPPSAYRRISNLHDSFCPTGYPKPQ